MLLTSLLNTDNFPTSSILFKKSVFLGLIFFCIFSSASWASSMEEVLVVGQPIENSEPDFSMNNSSVPVVPNTSYGTTMTAEAMEQKKAAEESGKKAACHGEAEAAKEQCENAYQDLNNICQAYIGMLGGYGAAKLLEKMADGAQVLVGRAITISTASGANLAEEVPGCAYFTNRAMDFCADGANKMMKKCSRL